MNMNPESKFGTPYFYEQHGELHAHPMGSDVVVDVGTNQKVVIDKLFGPLCASEVRVFLQHDGDRYDWVVEYLNPTTELWEEKARWCCQENWPEAE